LNVKRGRLTGKETRKMVYVVRGILVGQGSTFRAEHETMQAAMKSAAELRDLGFQVTITDPDGRPVEEIEDE
jgi:hypothetical protein